MRGVIVRSCAAGALLLAVLLLSAPGVLHAQEPTAANSGSAEDRATSFQAVQGAVKEDVPGGPLLVGAYAIVWLAVLGYVWRLGRLHARVETQLGTLERALAAGPDASSKRG